MYDCSMKNEKNISVEKKTQHIPRHLQDKRTELIWSLSDQQEYLPVDIQRIFNFIHLSTVTRIIARKPVGWKSPWKKIL